MSTYVKHELLNGVLQPEEQVSAEFVERFSSRKTRAFFEGLGGTEAYEEIGEVIVVTSVSPDKETVRVVTFTPIEEEVA